jgi:valine--pyruvate aminotransferase
MHFSTFGEKFGKRAGILHLMDDLGEAMSGRADLLMLGGGNPARIPEMEAVWRRRMNEILADGDAFDRMLGHYDPPRGNPHFLDDVAAFLRRQFGWAVTADNLCVTSGGQSAFFGLLNMLAGPGADGTVRRILFPLMPEYIGYADQGLAPNLFTARAPKIEFREPHRFKYHIDFDRLAVGPDTAALCVSRPTNPTGNVVTDEEMRRLDALAKKQGVPLVLDNAYGLPFPGILFVDAEPFWNENVIMTLSLSKIGLPGTRTAVLIGPPEVARAMAAMNAIQGLANGNVGQALTAPLFRNDDMLRLSREVVRPFYNRKSEQALAWVDELFDPGLDYHVHVSEGALFLWFWFRGLPITTDALYERLKRRRVLVVPGEYFFFGLDEDTPQRHECIRVNYSQNDATVREGLSIIADEVRLAYRA